jgi:hypothetical protein
MSMSMAFDASMRKLLDDVMAGRTPPLPDILKTDQVIIRGSEVIHLEDDDFLLKVHHGSKCKGRSCVIHNPTEHSMRKLPLHYRADRNIFERICSHGVGHPDPDQRDFFYEQGFLSAEVCEHDDLVKDCLDGCVEETTPEQRGEAHRDAQMIHGCCGQRCCQLEAPPPRLERG